MARLTVGIACSGLLAGCGLFGSHGGKAGPKPTVGPDSANSGTLGGPGAEPSDSSSLSIPFPEVVDSAAGKSDSAFLASLSTGLSVGDSSDSTRDWALPQTPVRPASKFGLSGSRPEGILQRPRPQGLPGQIHVLLSRSAKPLLFYSLGDMQILAEPVGAGKTAANTGLAVRLAILKGRFLLRRSGGGFSIEQARKDPIITSARGLRLISLNPYNLVDMGSGVYRGSLHILGEANGEISAINVLGVEDYLRGVLPYELGSVDREALEALKAQAIVARTYAYKRMLRPGSAPFHLYSDVQDQVYKGVRGEYLLSDRAVWETRGMAVTHADTLALCYYFSTCGGRTAAKDEVWGGEPVPYLVSRPDTNDFGDSYCIASKYSSWEESWSAPQLSGILRRNLRSAGVADYPSFSILKGIEVAQRASCGRIRVLKLSTDRGPILVKGDKVRWALRPSANEKKILPSASFDVKLAGGRVSVNGKGYGHGVGLCQVGSIGRARAKQNYREIIEAYYKDVKLVEFK
ncbi:MAG: SpoIID/LytB domain-containing protein [Fibrobacteria bacterium]